MISTIAIYTSWAFFSLSILGLLLYIVAVWALRQHLRDSLPPLSALPPLSLLKPLKGLEDTLEENLRSFFEQDYPGAFEIVFATTEADPALELAKSIASDYPEVPVQFIRSSPRFGLNPKVSNLQGALEAATYDLVHQSDANVRAQSHYLRDIVSEYIQRKASMLTSPVIGVGEETIGAAMENLQLTGFIAPGMCAAARVINLPCVCGKSMLFRRSELRNEVGGLEVVRNVLCEDFVLGERYQAIGKRVILSNTPIQNVNRDCGVGRFFERHTRWLKIRATLHRTGFVGDLLVNPIGLVTLAMVFSGFSNTMVAGAVAVASAKLMLEQLCIRSLRPAMRWHHALATLLKDFLLIPMWMYSARNRTVNWRGRKIAFGRNTEILMASDQNDSQEANPVIDLARY